MAEPAIAFRVREHDEPALEIRVNFGVFAGRDVTSAEIDDLARKLVPELSQFSVIAERRHEFGGVVEASLHQVCIEVPQEAVGGDDLEYLCGRLTLIAETWVEACIAERHAEISEL